MDVSWWLKQDRAGMELTGRAGQITQVPLPASLAEQRVVVEVILNKGQVWADPADAGTKMAQVNGWSERQWRHLDTCQFETVIQARIPQLKYSDGTVEELTVPWAERYSRVPVLPSSHDRLSNR